MRISRPELRAYRPSECVFDFELPEEDQQSPEVLAVKRVNIRTYAARAKARLPLFQNRDKDDSRVA